MRLFDMDSKEDYLLDGKYKVATPYAPLVDVVEVVRCGECKYLMANGICNMFADDNIKPSASDFCSYGERKDEEADK